MRNTHTQPFYGPLGFCLRLPELDGTRKINQSGFTGARDAVASAGPYASLHIDPDTTTKHPTSQFFTGWMPFLPPNSIKALRKSDI